MIDELVQGSLLLRDDLIRNYVLLPQNSIEVLYELHRDDFMWKLVIVFVKEIGELKV